ncbi:hypothetical protein GCM10023082_03400 [Streptomyces tremellae]|uniref:Uncharacterized protein n=1 Tax=Streptomyces tremellae TaxID=1124239 RepID=A0ABP7DQ37_9ACTN
MIPRGTLRARGHPAGIGRPTRTSGDPDTLFPPTPGAPREARPPAPRAPPAPDAVRHQALTERAHTPK